MAPSTSLTRRSPEPGVGSFFRGLTKPFRSHEPETQSSSSHSSGPQPITAEPIFSGHEEAWTPPAESIPDRLPPGASSFRHTDIAPEGTAPHDTTPRVPPNTPGFATPYHGSTFPPTDGIDTPPRDYEAFSGYGNRVTDPPEAHMHYGASSQEWWGVSADEVSDKLNTWGSRDSGSDIAREHSPSATQEAPYDNGGEGSSTWWKHGDGPGGAAGAVVGKRDLGDVAQVWEWQLRARPDPVVALKAWWLEISWVLLVVFVFAYWVGGVARDMKVKRREKKKAARFAKVVVSPEGELDAAGLLDEKSAAGFEIMPQMAVYRDEV